MEEIKETIETKADAIIEEEKTETIKEEAEETPHEQKVEEETLSSSIEQLKKENYELKKEKIFKEQDFDPKYYDFVEKLSEGNLDVVKDERFEVFKKSKDLYKADANFQEKKVEAKVESPKKEINNGEFEYATFDQNNN